MRDIREVGQAGETPTPRSQFDIPSTPPLTFNKLDIENTHTLDDRSRDSTEDDEKHRSEIGEK